MNGNKEGIYSKGQKLRPQWLHVHLMFVTLESQNAPPLLKVIDRHMFSKCKHVLREILQFWKINVFFFPGQRSMKVCFQFAQVLYLNIKTVSTKRQISTKFVAPRTDV